MTTPEILPKEKQSRKKVPVGTYVDPSVRIGLESLVEAKGMTVYQYLQDRIESDVTEFLAALEESKKASPKKDTAADLF